MLMKLKWLLLDRLLFLVELFVCVSADGSGVLLFISELRAKEIFGNVPELRIKRRKRK